MIDEKKARSIVNSSGFPLQIGIENLVREHSDLGWQVLTREHSWFNPENNYGSFIDLVLENEASKTLLTFECKRVKDTSWIFLQEEGSSSKRRHIKTWVAAYISSHKGLRGWTDSTGYPETPESEFCVVAGQDSKSKPMLERIAAELIESTEAFAEQDCEYHKDQPDFTRIFVPVIVTTAELQICKFNFNDVSLATGEIGQSADVTVPYLRFRKQLSNRSYLARFKHGVNYREIDRVKENTVFIVNSNHVADFLAEIEIHEN